MDPSKASTKTCPRRMIDWIVYQFFPEFKCLVTLAWPIILMNMFRFLNPTISIVMCGHLTKTEFAAASLANALINVFGVSVDLGFSTACDTIFSQIYGSKNKRKLGLMLQRAILVMIIIYLLLSCFHLNIEPLLVALRQDIEVSRLTARYVAIYLPGLFFDFLFLAISRYLQNQNIVYPMMISTFISCVFNIICQYIGIYVLGFGLDASAVIQAFGCFVMFNVQFAYVLISKVYVHTWDGFDFRNAIEGWGVYFKLGLPGIIMIGAEEWAFEIGYFIAGYLSESQLGTHSIAFQIEYFCYMVHCGIAISVAIRAGQFLGANDPVNASLSAKVVVITDMFISLCTITMILALRQYLPNIFTNNEEIRQMAEKLLLIVVGVQIFDAGCSSTAGIFRACGLQMQGAAVMMVCYYVIGVPLGFILIFVVHMDIQGFWLGLLIALGIEVIIYLIMIYRINWDKEAAKAQKLVKQPTIREFDNEEFTSLSESETEKLLQPAVKENYQKHIHRVSQISGRRSIGSISGIDSNSLKKILEMSKGRQTKRSTIIKRLVLCGITLILYISSILIKVYVPRGAYVPCISIYSNESTLPLDKHYPFCNDTIYNY